MKGIRYPWINNLKEEIVVRYQGGENIESIAESYSASYNAVWKRLCKWGIPRDNTLVRFSDLERQQIVSLYESGIGTPSIGLQFGVHDVTIRRWLVEWGSKIRSRSEANSLSGRSHPINHDCFSFDTDECRYWFGFFMADGAVGRYKNQTAQISLTIIDLEHIQKFRDFSEAGDKKISLLFHVR